MIERNIDIVMKNSNYQFKCFNPESKCHTSPCALFIIIIIPMSLYKQHFIKTISYNPLHG